MHSVNSPENAVLKLPFVIPTDLSTSVTCIRISSALSIKMKPKICEIYVHCKYLKVFHCSNAKYAQPGNQNETAKQTKITILFNQATEGMEIRVVSDSNRYVAAIK